MIGKEYSSPDLRVVILGQTDVICASNYEWKDVMQEDNGIWDE